MKKLILILVLSCLCSTAFAGMAEKISMDFRDTDVRDIFKIVATRGGFGIAPEKSVRGNLTLSMKDVTVKEALDIITKASGFAWEKIGNTIVVADEKKLESRQIKVISLKFLPAPLVAKILSISIKADVKIATNEYGNSVVLNGSKEGIEQSMLIVGQIDKPIKFICASLKIVQGNKTIHRFDFSARVGELVDLKEHLKIDPIMVGEDKKHNISDLDCGLRFNGLSNDGHLDAELNMGMLRVERKSDIETSRKFAVQFQAEKGKSVEVFAATENDPIRVIFTWEK